MAGGRPTTYDPKFCEMIIAELETGKSILAASAKCGFSKQTAYNWMEEHPEFFDAVKHGQSLSALWWENVLCNIATGGDGNPTAAIFGLKNRGAAEWRDKTEVVNDTKITEIKRVIVQPDKE